MSKLRYTHLLKCTKCKEDFERDELLLAVDTFKTFCIDCSFGEKHLIPIDNKIIENNINKNYPDDFAKLLQYQMQKSYSIRPNMTTVYYLMQLAEKKGIKSWNGALNYIINEYILANPLDERVTDDPFTQSHYTKMDKMVENPFAIKGSIKTEVEAEREPKEEEPEEEKDDDIFTI